MIQIQFIITLVLVFSPTYPIRNSIAPFMVSLSPVIHIHTLLCLPLLFICSIFLKNKTLTKEKITQGLLDIHVVEV